MITTGRVKCFILTFYRYKFHYHNEHDITFLCLSEDMNDDLVFAFLSDVRKKFIQTYDYDKLAGYHAYQLTEFNGTLKQLIVNTVINLDLL